MGFKEVTTQATDIKQFEGEAFEGYYIGSKDIETKIGPQVIYKFRKPGGSSFQVYGFTNLNRAMEMVNEGCLCRLTYTGMEEVETKFGLKNVHQVKVEVDEEDIFEKPDEETKSEPF